MVTLCGPHLLAVDDPLVTIENCRCLQACKVRTRVGLRETLAPAHRAIENLWKEFLLLLFGSPLQKCGAHKSVSKEVCTHWCFRVSEFFRQHNALHCGQTFAAVFLWPCGANPAAFKKFRWPFIVELFTLIVGHIEIIIEPTFRQVLFQPSADLRAELFVFGGIGEFHGV